MGPKSGIFDARCLLLRQGEQIFEKKMEKDGCSGQVDTKTVKWGGEVGMLGALVRSSWKMWFVPTQGA